MSRYAFWTIAICIVVFSTTSKADEPASKNASRLSRRNAFMVKRQLSSAMAAIDSLTALGQEDRARHEAKRLLAYFGGTIESPEVSSSLYPLLWKIANAADNSDYTRRLSVRWFNELQNNIEMQQASSTEDMLVLVLGLKEIGKADSANRVAEIALGVLNEDGAAIAISELHNLRAIAVAVGRKNLVETIDRKADSALRTDGRLNLMSPPHELADLAEIYRASANKDMYSEIIHFITSDYLDQAGLCEAMRLSDWMALMSTVTNSEDAQAKADVARKFLSAFRARPSLIDRLPRGGSIIPLLTQLQCLGVTREACGEIVAAHLDMTDHWNVFDSTLREAILVAVESGGNRQAVARVEAQVRGEGEPALHEIGAVISLCRHYRHADALKEWKRILWDHELNAKTKSFESLTQAGEVIRSMARLRPVLSTEDTRSLIDLISQLPDEDTAEADAVYRSLGALLDDSDSSAELLKRIDAMGRDVSMPLVKVTAWQQRTLRQGRPFAGRLMQLGDKGGYEGDSLALWRLSQGYAMGIMSDQVMLRVHGNHYFGQALAAAESSEIRLRCLAMIHFAARIDHRYNEALQITESSIERFDDPDRPQVLAMLAELKAHKQGWEQEAAAKRERHEDTDRWRNILTDRRRNRGRLSEADKR